MSFDLDAYFERIRLGDRPACDLDGLAAVQRAHRLAIPFENLDIRLGRGIAIDSASVFAKLVTRRRGGYCFEQNRLFCDALTALGFAVRPLLARVWFANLRGETRPHGSHLKHLPAAGPACLPRPVSGGAGKKAMPPAGIARRPSPLPQVVDNVGDIAGRPHRAR